MIPMGMVKRIFCIFIFCVLANSIAEATTPFPGSIIAAIKVLGQAKKIVLVE